MRITQKYINELSYKIIGLAIEVHKHLGPGLLESVYHICMFDEIVKDDDLFGQSEINVPIQYKGRNLGSVLKLDILVNDLIILEFKAVEEMHPIYKAQLLSYLKLTKKPKGLLINFNCENISKNTISMVTEEYAKLPKE